VPEGALILDNPNGTAPGLAIEVRPNSFCSDGKPSWLVMLPGPPRELRPMFSDHVLPMLRRHFPIGEPIVSRTLRTVGMGESALADKVTVPLDPLVSAGLELGYCAHMGAVDVRLIGHGSAATQIVADAEAIVRRELGTHIFGTGDDELHTVIVRMLTERKLTLATAESCTGGYIANRITSVPGSSAVFLGGAVTYSNEVKQALLGVQAETLAQHGAVSEPVAREMAEGARTRLGADLAIATTGIAGPDGGTPQKTVGTVFIALATAKHTFVLNPTNRYERETFKHITCLQALELLRRTLLKL
jgi:nicotinamide-nucleotide amidase